MKSIVALPMTVLMLAAQAHADDLPGPVRAAVDQAKAECTAFENGELALEEGALVQVDLTGNGVLDWVVDTLHMQCSSAASLFCGTGGCQLNLIVAEITTDAQSKGWDVIDFGPNRVVLMDVHGSMCDGINPTPCVAALSWDPEALQFRSITASPF